MGFLFWRGSGFKKKKIVEGGGGGGEFCVCFVCNIRD